MNAEEELVKATLSALPDERLAALIGMCADHLFKKHDTGASDFGLAITTYTGDTRVNIFRETRG